MVYTEISHMQAWLLLGARIKSSNDFYTHWNEVWVPCGAWQCLNSCGWCVRSTWHLWLACSLPINLISHIDAFITAMFHYRLFRSLYVFPLFLWAMYMQCIFFFFACASKQADLPVEASNLSNLLISQSSELENWAQFFLFPRISAAKRRQEKMGKALKNFFSDMWYWFWGKNGVNNFYIFFYNHKFL